MTIQLTQPPLTEDVSWRQDALCAQTDPDVFFPERGQSLRPARRICGRCAVRSHCLTYALDTGQTFGIWGGLTAPQRRTLRAGGLDYAA